MSQSKVAFTQLVVTTKMIIIDGKTQDLCQARVAFTQHSRIDVGEGESDLSVVVVEVENVEQEAKAPQGNPVKVLRDFEVLYVGEGGNDLSVVVVEVENVEQEAKAPQGNPVEVLRMDVEEVHLE